MANKDKKKLQRSTIVIEIKESVYMKFLDDIEYAHEILGREIENHPELFPCDLHEQGYKFNGYTRESEKTGYVLRKIKVGDKQYQIRPSFILPHMRGKTKDASNAMFLLKFNVPFWALAYVFGRSPMFYYRLAIELGKNSLVGTTIKFWELLPEHLLSDEEHIEIMGIKAYIATTISHGCILGSEASYGCGEEELKAAYSVYKKEAQDVKSDYSPKTVNTDGWAATKNAWKCLFPKICIIQCFLHAYIKIRDRALKKMQDTFKEISQKVWDCYKAESKRCFSQRVRRLKKWTEEFVPDSIMKDKVLELCSKCRIWQRYYDFPGSYRTSNALDRLMKLMTRHKYAYQNYHGNVETTTLNIRAFALIHNFAPSNPEAIKKHNNMKSPFERLNKFKYHDDWLQNLLIAASLAGYRNQHSNPI